MAWMLYNPCSNVRKVSVKFTYGSMLPVTECELIFEEEILLKWLYNKTVTELSRYLISLLLKEKFALLVKAK